MKKILLFSSIVFMCIGCSSDQLMNNTNEEEIIDKNLPVVRETMEIADFEGTGVNFVVTPHLGTKTNNDKYIYELEAVYPTLKESIKTTLTQTFNEDGSYSITHSHGEYQFATLYYTADEQLIDIKLIQSGGTKSLSSWYGCVNKRYNELMDLIEHDVANSLVCTFTFGMCNVLSAMAGVEHCR